MPLDTSITNVGEYFSSHYLDSTFAKDVKDLVARWKEEGSQSAPRKLQSLSQTYFRAKTQAIDEEEPIRRHLTSDLVRGWHSALLAALGYRELTPTDIPVEGGDAHVPAVGRVARYNKPWLVVCQNALLPARRQLEGRAAQRGPARDVTGQRRPGHDERSQTLRWRLGTLGRASADRRRRTAMGDVACR